MFKKEQEKIYLIAVVSNCLVTNNHNLSFLFMPNAIITLSLQFADQSSIFRLF